MNENARDDGLVELATIRDLLAQINAQVENHANRDIEAWHYGHVGDLRYLSGCLREARDFVKVGKLTVV